MAYFYVKSSYGTRIAGGGTTKQTGAYSSLGVGNVYATITLAITDGAGSGDFIICSDVHDHDYGTSQALITLARIVGADDANCDVESFGAIEECTTAGADLSITNAICHSMTFKAADDMWGNDSNFYKCLLHIGTVSGGAQFGWLASAADKLTKLHYCTIHSINNLTSFFRAQTTSIRCHLELIGTNITAGGTVTSIFRAGSASQTVTMRGGSLPDCTNLLENAAGDAHLYLSNVDLGTYTNESSAALSLLDEIILSGCSSGDNNLEDILMSYSGKAEVDTTTYLNASDGTTSFSKKIITTANASFIEPFRVKLGMVRLDASTAKTVTVQILHDSAANLTDDEVFIDLVYQDDTTNKGWVENSLGDVLSPSDIITSSEVWTEDLTDNNEQEMAVTTSETGDNAVAEVWINITKASYTLWADPAFVVT